MSQTRTGHLVIYTGCMYSGKTDALIAKLRHLTQLGEEVLVFKPQVDDRFQKRQLCSQTGKKWKAININSPAEIEKYLNKYSHIKIIAIDETQFMDPSLIKYLERWLNHGYDIYLSGLDRGFSDHNLPVMNLALAYADQVIKLFAYCNKCQSLANKTQRVDHKGVPISPAKFIKMHEFVGGIGKYEARCRSCYVYFPWPKDN